VSWKFRMQGHSENKHLIVSSFNLAPAVDISFQVEGTAATSVAIIEVTYAPPGYEDEVHKCQKLNYCMDESLMHPVQTYPKITSKP
jgi:hypothetical protein